MKYEDLSSEIQKLYSQVVRAYQLIPQMYNRLTIVDRLSHKDAILKMANDHKHLPGFSDRNVRRYLPSYNPNIPRRVRTRRPKNSATISVDNPKLSVSEHKQNELIDESLSAHIETSSSTLSGKHIVVYTDRWMDGWMEVLRIILKHVLL